MKNSKKTLLRSFKKLLPYMAITMVVFLFFWKVFIKGLIPFPGDFVTGVYYPWLDYKWGYEVGVPVKNPITADVPSYIYPMQTLVVDLYKSGQLPLWNPYILSGAPLMANLQSAAFSPTIFVYFLFDKITAWTIQIMLQHILAAVFTFMLLRHWKVSKLAAWAGAIIFSFSGFNMIWSQWNGHTLSAAFLPLILLFQDKFLLSFKYKYGLGFSISIFLLILSGYQQVVLYALVAGFLLWVVRMFEVKRRLVKTIWLGIFGTLSFGLAGLQLLPALELFSDSQRNVEPHPALWAFLPWNKVITFFAPDFFGNHSTYNYWGPQDYTSNTGFSGIIAWIFASFAVLYHKKNRIILFSFLLFFASLILSFATPISTFLWKTNALGLQAAAAHRALVLMNLSIAILAAFGIDKILETDKLKIIKALIIPFVVIVGFGIWALFVQQNVAIRNLVLPSMILAISTAILMFVAKFRNLKKLGVLLLIALMVFELFRFGWKFTPFSIREFVYPSTPIFEYLEKQDKPYRVTGNKVVPVNLRMPYKLESLEGYESIHPLKISQFLSAINAGKSDEMPVGRYGIIDADDSHLLDLTNTKYYLTLKYNEENTPYIEGVIPERFQTDRFEVAFEDKTTVILESKSALPRAFMVYDWEVIDDRKQILDKILNPDFPISKKIILNKRPSIQTTTSSENTVRLHTYYEQGIGVEVITDNHGMLFLSDAFYPGWNAYVDGQLVEIYQANFAFRAIEIPKGKHEVRFIYEPKSFDDGVKLSLVSLAILLAIYPLKKLY